MFDGEDTTMNAPVEPTVAPAEETIMPEATDAAPVAETAEAPVQE